MIKQIFRMKVIDIKKAKRDLMYIMESLKKTLK